MRVHLQHVVLAASLVSGCTATHAIYVYDASVGIDLAYSSEGTGKLVFGYDRDTYALVPKKDDATDDELMSLAAVSKVQSEGLNKLDFDHFVATGGAATGVATDPDGLARIRSAIFGESKK
jgi:hypothetical protein